MGKKIFGIYLAKLDAPNSEAHARLELPASPLELHDAMDKVQLQENEELYLEIDDYYGFEYLAPHLMELDASLNELNDLAGRLAVLDETEQEAFDGLLRLEIQIKVESNGSILTMEDLRTLAVSAGADCCHVVGATSDAELGRFYAENGFMEELDGLSDDVFEMLDFGKIGKALRTGENGTFTRSGYVVKHSELVTAPPCAKELPEKPEYLFRLTLGLHPDLEDDRTVTLELPASAEALRKVQKQLGADGWEGAMVLDYDGIIPQAAEFADLPMELDAFNDFAEAVEDMPSREKQIPKLKALLEHFEVTDLATAAGLAEHIGDYILTPEISSPQEAAIDELNFTIQNLSRELFAVADENGGKLQNRAVLYCDEFGTMPPFDVLPLFSAGRSRRLTLVPIIQSLAQLEKNYGKEGSEIIQDNCQDTIFGGFAPNSQTAEVLSKALGNRTVLSGSVSRGKNDPSQSLQMMERPLLTPDELKSIPKGNFIVQKTGQHPMRTRLRLFLEWGITFEEPYIVPERADRAVAYANREDLERNLPQSNKAENADMRGAYAVSGRGGIAHEPAVDKPRRRGGKQMKTYGEEDL